jgi:glutamate-1-semialdehyde 2,1-aminomutase
MNLVLPEVEFLRTLREECSRHGALLIFDEVMTGFRLCAGGAQALYGIKPDLTTLGKVIGGGLPVAAFGGRADIMEHIAPTGPVYQAGTLSGNPVALAAGLATLKLTQAHNFYDELASMTKALVEGLQDAARHAGVDASAQSIGGMFGIYFKLEPPHRFAEVMECDVALFKRFFHEMLDHGLYFAPSAFEAGFVSSAHTMEHIETTVAAARKVFLALKSS